jgi:hypothetical protein
MKTPKDEGMFVITTKLKYVQSAHGFPKPVRVTASSSAHKGYVVLEYDWDLTEYQNALRTARKLGRQLFPQERLRVVTFRMKRDWGFFCLPSGVKLQGRRVMKDFGELND